MARIESALLSLGSLNELAAQDTAIHRRDPRAKLVTTAVFIITVVSFNKYDISGLLPFILYPIVLTSLGNVPSGGIFRKILIASPFAIFIGIFNPLLDRQILMHIGPIGISGGWLSFASILLRFALTVSVALILIATTGFEAVCLSLERMKVPRVFVTQLLFMYRYLFVLIEEALRMVRAFSLRSFSAKRVDIGVFGSLVGQLLLRTMHRAQRIHAAMLSRGFDGRIPLLRSFKADIWDAAFILFWSAFFVLARMYNIPHYLGTLFLAALP